MPDPIQVKRQALSDIRSVLNTIHAKARVQIEQAHSAINELRRRLEDQKRYWMQRRDQAERDLARCRASGSPDGPPPDCSTHERALQEAMAAIRTIEGLIARLEQAVSAYTPFRDQLNHVIEKEIPQAVSFLDQHITHVDHYGT